MNPQICLSLLPAVMLGIGLGLASSPAFAVHDSGTFELDGDAQDDGATDGDDWSTLYSGGGSATAFSGIVQDVTADQIFAGGKSKTIYDIPDWKHKSASPGSPPDKNNITHAYAANYVVEGEQVIYFGADLYDPNGDAELAFWFFQGPVAEDGGGFTGHHEDGDVYVAAKFGNGGTDAIIAVYEWWSACDGAVQNPGVGDCAADNIRVVSVPSESTCNGFTGDASCAIANTTPQPSPWPYTPKSGSADTFPPTTFFEGGLNVTQAFGESKCFASFMATSGASTSFTSTSKDYALGEFDVCSVGATKKCVNDVTTDDTPSAITYNVRGCAINNGAAGIKITDLMNSIGGANKYAPTDLSWYHPGQVDSGRDFDPATDCDNATWLKEAVDYGTLVTDLGNTVVGAGEALIYQFSETTDQNAASDTVTIGAEGADGTAINSAEASDTCPLRTFSAALSVTKQCAADLEDAGNRVVVKIGVQGTVCNTGEVTLTNLSLVDSTGGSVTPVTTTLAPAGQAGDCTSYTGSYYPESIPSGDICPFADQVTATAYAPANSTCSECSANSNSATCNLRIGSGDADCSTGKLSDLPQ